MENSESKILKEQGSLTENLAGFNEGGYDTNVAEDRER